MGYPISLEGKVALVVGGAGGIGAATSRMLADAGAQVAITHLDRPELASAAADLIGTLSGSGHSAFPADVANTPSLVELRDAIQQRYGRLDILINAAGWHCQVNWKL